MIIVDKKTLTRFARSMRAAAASHGTKAGHSVFLEAASAAPGFRSLNAAVALLRKRPIVIGVPRGSLPQALWFQDFYIDHNDTTPYGVAPDKVAVQAARFMQTCMDEKGAVRQPCIELLTGMPSENKNPAFFIIGDWEAGTRVAPDVDLSVSPMSLAAGTHVCAALGMRSPEGEWADEATWQHIVVQGLCEGVMSVEPIMHGSPLLDAAVAALNGGRGPSADVGGTWAGADEALVEMLQGMGIETDRAPAVRTQIFLDNGQGRAVFDAAAFLKDADVQEVVELAECGWRGDYPADNVAWHVRNLPGYEHVDALFDRIEHEGLGFEVAVDPEQAMAWLAVHRPLAHAAVLFPHQGQPQTAGELVARLEALASNAASNYDNFRDFAVRFLDGLDSHDADDEAWHAVEELVRRPDTDDVGWIMDQARSLVSTHEAGGGGPGQA